jgi:chromate reductase, NAD(P)H dehydrogenase (quinone)
VAGGDLLLICGSTRPGSSNLLALQAVRDLDLPGPQARLYEGLTELPAFVPDQQPVPAPVADLLGRIRAADAVLFSTPEYAGGLPGSLKNLLDWTVGGGELYGKPVAWLDVAAPGRGQGARDQLATVLGYVGARVVERACVHLPVQRAAGEVALPPEAGRVLADAVTALLAAA